MSARSKTELNQTERPSLEMLVLYDEPAAGCRAKALYDDLVAGFDEELRIELKLWRSDLLMLPESREQLRSNADARLLVVAVKARSSLPEGFTEWLAAWSKNRTHEDAALAVVAERAADKSTTSQIVGALRQAAERRGLAFFCSTESAESGGEKRATQLAHRESARGLSPALAKLLDRAHAWDHRGLNE